MDGMMPPPGGMPMGPPLAGQAPNQQKSKDTVYGGSRRGRANFKNFMQQKSQVGVPQVQMPQMPQMPQVPVGPQPMLPTPAPQMMGALPSPQMGGLPSIGGLGQQADVGGGVGSAPMQFADGGAVEVPRRTEIYGADHMLAYIRPDEAEILKGLGAMGTPGPGGIPQFNWFTDTWAEIVSGGAAETETYNGGNEDNDRDNNVVSVSSGDDEDNDRSNVGSSGYVSLDAIANEAVQSDPDLNFSYMGETYDNVFDYHDAIFGDDDSPSTSVDTTPVNTNITDTSSLSGIADASGDDYVYNPDAGTVDYDPIVSTGL